MVIKILLLDIETAPNLALIWGLFNQNINIQNVLESGYVLCWAAKWLGEDVIYFDSVHRSSEKQMLRRIHALLSEADAVVHYNGKRFDIPTLNKEFVMQEMAPPSPYKQIDLLTTVRTQFRFTSTKLQFVCQQLGIGEKAGHSGPDLWIKCMNQDPEAWKMMEEYNIQDVELLEGLYYKLLPWIKSHPNYSVYTGEMVCPNCGSHKHQKRGFSYTLAGKYQRYNCKDCGNWFRGIKNVADRSKFVTNGV